MPGVVNGTKVPAGPCLRSRFSPTKSTLSRSLARPEGNEVLRQPLKVWRPCAPLLPVIAPESGHASGGWPFLAPPYSSSAHWRLVGKKPLPSRARNLGASRKRAPCLPIPARRAAAQALLQLARRPIAPRKAARASAASSAEEAVTSPHWVVRNLDRPPAVESSGASTKPNIVRKCAAALKKKHPINPPGRKRLRLQTVAELFRPTTR